MDIALSHQEEKNKRIAAVVSVVLHALIVLLLFYILAYRPKGDPAKEIGIELNFGTSAVGSGNVQTTAMPNESKNVQDSKPAPTQPDPEPEPKPVAAAAPPATPVEAPKVVTATAESPVSVKEVVKPQPKPQPQPKEVAKTEPVKPVEEPKKEPEKPRALFPGKPTESTGTGKSGTASTATGNNNGDDANAVGDKGSPDGKVEAKALYGRGGGGAGGLDLAGWRYEIAPKRDPYPNENGIVKFKITINGNGELVGISTVESNVSPHVKKWYEDQLRKTTFVPTGGSTGQGATGYVTFVIRSN